MADYDPGRGRESRSRGRRSSILKRQDTCLLSEGSDGFNEGSRTPKRVSFASTAMVRTIEPNLWHAINSSASDDNNSGLNTTCDANDHQDDVFAQQDPSLHEEAGRSENQAFPEHSQNYQDKPPQENLQYQEQAETATDAFQQDLTIYYSHLDNSDNAMELTANIPQPPITLSDPENYSGANVSQPRLDRIPSFSEEQAADEEDNSIFFKFAPGFKYPTDNDNFVSEKTFLFNAHSDNGMDITCNLAGQKVQNVNHGAIEEKDHGELIENKLSSVEREDTLEDMEMTGEQNLPRGALFDITAHKALTPIEEMSLASSNMSEADRELIGQSQKLNFSQLRSRLVESISTTAHLHDKENWPIIKPEDMVVPPLKKSNSSEDGNAAISFNIHHRSDLKTGNVETESALNFIKGPGNNNAEYYIPAGSTDAKMAERIMSNQTKMTSGSNTLADMEFTMNVVENKFRERDTEMGERTKFSSGMSMDLSLVNYSDSRGSANIGQGMNEINDKTKFLNNASIDLTECVADKVIDGVRSANVQRTTEVKADSDLSKNVHQETQENKGENKVFSGNVDGYNKDIYALKIQEKQGEIQRLNSSQKLRETDADEGTKIFNESMILSPVTHNSTKRKLDGNDEINLSCKLQPERFKDNDNNHARISACNTSVDVTSSAQNNKFKATHHSFRPDVSSANISHEIRERNMYLNTSMDLTSNVNMNMVRGNERGAPTNLSIVDKPYDKTKLLEESKEMASFHHTDRRTKGAEDGINVSNNTSMQRFVADDIKDERTKITDMSMDLTACYETSFVKKSAEVDGIIACSKAVSKRLQDDNTCGKTKIFNSSMDITSCYDTSIVQKSGKGDRINASSQAVSERFQDDSTRGKTKVFNSSMDITSCYDTSIIQKNVEGDRTNAISQAVSERFQDDSTCGKTKIFNSSMDMTSCNNTSIIQKGIEGDRTNATFQAVSERFQDDNTCGKTKIFNSSMDITSCYETNLVRKDVEGNRIEACSQAVSERSQNNNIHGKTTVFNTSVDMTSRPETSSVSKLSEKDRINTSPKVFSQRSQDDDTCGKTKIFNTSMDMTSCYQTNFQKTTESDEIVNVSLKLAPNRLQENSLHDATHNADSAMAVSTLSQNSINHQSQNQKKEKQRISDDNEEKTQSVTEKVNGFVSEKTLRFTDEDMDVVEVVSFTSYNSPHLSRGITGSKSSSTSSRSIVGQQNHPLLNNIAGEKTSSGKASTTGNVLDQSNGQEAVGGQQTGGQLLRTYRSFSEEDAIADPSAVTNFSNLINPFSPASSQRIEADVSRLMELSKVSSVVQSQPSIVHHHSTVSQHPPSSLPLQQSMIAQHPSVISHQCPPEVRGQLCTSSTSSSSFENASSSPPIEQSSLRVSEGSSEHSSPREIDACGLSPSPTDVNAYDDTSEDSCLLRDQEMPDLLEHNGVMPAIESFDEDNETNFMMDLYQSCTEQKVSGALKEATTGTVVDRELKLSNIYEALGLDDVQPLVQQQYPMRKLDGTSSLENQLGARLFAKPQLNCLQNYIDQLKGEIARSKKSLSSLMEHFSTNPPPGLLNTLTLLKEGNVSGITSQAQHIAKICEANAKAQINKLQADHLLDLTSAHQTKHESLKTEFSSLTSDNKRVLELQSIIDQWNEKLEVLSQSQSEIKTLEKDARGRESKLSSLQSQSQSLDRAIEQTKKATSECCVRKVAMEDEQTAFLEKLGWMASLSEWTLLKNNPNDLSFGFFNNTVVANVQFMGDCEDPHRRMTHLSVTSRMSASNKPWVLVAHRVMMANIKPQSLKCEYGKFNSLTLLLTKLSERTSMCRDLCKELRKAVLLYQVEFEQCRLKVKISSRKTSQVEIETDLADGRYPCQPLKWTVVGVLGFVSSDTVQAALDHVSVGEGYLIRALDSISRISKS